MKSSIVRALVALSIGAVLSPVALLAQNRLAATIPFDFTAGQRLFAAGDYTVQLINDHGMLIQNAKTGASIMTTTIHAEKSERAGAYLTFNRYGERYFLSSIRGRDVGWRVYPSKAEKEILAKSGRSTSVGLAAAVRPK